MTWKVILEAKFWFGVLCGVLLASGLWFPVVYDLKTALTADNALLSRNTQTIISASDALTACARSRIERNLGSTLLLDLHSTGTIALATPDDPVTSIPIGPFRLGLKINRPPGAPLWDVPGRVVPRVLNDSPGAMYGYMDRNGEFQGWKIPEKEE
jgi:hypothetical protein